VQNQNVSLPRQEIYDSPEALEIYLHDIRVRREQRRQARIERLRLSIGLVRVELEAAQQDEDEEITSELQDVLREFEVRLQRTQLPASEADVSPPPPPLPEPPCAEPPTADVSSGTESVDLENPAIAVPVTRPEMKEFAVPSPIGLMVLSEDEREAKKRGWVSELSALTVRWNEIDAECLHHKDNRLNRPACLRARALGCSLARLQNDADQAGLGSDVINTVTSLRDKIEFARTYAGDACSVLPFDSTVWRWGAGRLRVEDWGDLACLYHDAAIAQEAWDWYAHNCEEMGNGNQHGLVNAIGAVQQMLFRALVEYGGTDRLQGDLYGSLLGAANSVGFLSSLHSDTTWAELEEIGRELPHLLALAKKEALNLKAREDKEAAKAAALNAVVQWQRRQKVGPVAAGSVEGLRTELLPLLDACVAAGIPSTNVQIRSAILEVAPVALLGLTRYAKFLDAVLTEHKRRRLDLVTAEEEGLEEADLPDDQILESKALVIALTEGQKVLILGGSARPQVAARLKGETTCREVEWIDTKKGDHMSKFKRDIMRSDVLIVVKKFASHEMTDKGREWAKEFGKMFVLLPGGYGVNQIINQMYLQLAQNDSGKKVSGLPLKSGGLSIADLNLV